MRTRFFIKLGWNSITRNGRLFGPFLLSSSFMVMMEYILFYLAGSDVISVPIGADTLNLMLRLGTFVVALFAFLFLIYTQSFLIKNQLGEFGLYYVLGLNRKDLSKVLLWQTLFCFLISVGSGLVLGILFSKLAELAFINLIHTDVNFNFSINGPAALFTVVLFAGIYLLLYLGSLIRIRSSSAVSLLKGSAKSEKPPKGNALLALAGFALLIFSYISAVRINNPLDSLIWFFGLVILVILATYMIMISGTVFLVNLLKKNSSFYYKTEHFISLSSIAFRLKRNGAGLASICILTTMVLVTLSSTAALYFGAQKATDIRYPREINLDFRFERAADLQSSNLQAIRENLDTLLEENGVEMENVISYPSMATSGLIQGDKVYLDPGEIEASLFDVGSVRQFFFVDASEYEASTGHKINLQDHQAIAYSNRNEKVPDKLVFTDDLSFEIVEQLDDLEIPGSASMNITSSTILIINDPIEQLQPIENLANYYGGSLLSKQYVYDFDFVSQEQNSESLSRILLNHYGKYLWKDEQVGKNEFGFTSVEVEDRASNIFSTYTFFGGFFFIGLMLSLVFALETVMIIYYKQISEGMEDQQRFEIMQRIGLNRKQILKSIRDQLSIVFFLPLVFSLMNLAFAFPVVEKLLMLFNLNDPVLFLWTNIGSAALFTVFYLIVYLLTTREYYRIIRQN